MSKAVSYSRVQGYKKCPASYEWKYLLGHPGSPPGPAASRGTRIHDSIEHYHKDEGPLDEEIKKPNIITHLNRYMDNPDWYAYPEMGWALTNQWDQTEFSADDAYIRGFMDGVWIKNDGVNVQEVVIDEYKTGKEYPEHADQKQLYAMAALSFYGHLSSVVVNGVYLDLGKIKPTLYMRAHLPAMQYTWKREIDKMAIPIYPARPGFHCRYCTKSMKKDGPCKVG